MNKSLRLFIAFCGVLFLIAVWSPAYGELIVEMPIVNTLAVFGGVVVLATLVSLPVRFFRNE